LLLVDSDFDRWVPIQDEVQFSRYADAMACVSFSATNRIEIQIKNLSLQSFNFSDRFLAKLSGTTKQAIISVPWLIPSVKLG